MTTKQVLVKARALIRKGWTQEMYAADVDGEQVEPDDPKACRWCADGALMAVSKGKPYFNAYQALGAVIDSPYTGSPVGFNDDLKRTKAQVLAAFDAAIKAQK